MKYTRQAIDRRRETAEPKCSISAIYLTYLESALSKTNWWNYDANLETN
ncbi:hypothetical protein [Microcoleus sp. BROC3]